MLPMLKVFSPLLLPTTLLVLAGLGDVETKALGVEVDLVVALLEDRSNISGVLELSEVNVTAALLDSVTNQLG